MIIRRGRQLNASDNYLTVSCLSEPHVTTREFIGEVLSILTCYPALMSPRNLKATQETLTQDLENFLAKRKPD